MLPGFEAEVQGLYREVNESGAMRFYSDLEREPYRARFANITLIRCVTS